MDVEALFRNATIELTAAHSRSFAYYDETLELRLSVRLPGEVDAATARTILSSPALSLTLDFGYIEKIETDSTVPRLALPVPPKRNLPPSPTTPAPFPSTSTAEDQAYAGAQPVSVSSKAIERKDLSFDEGDGRLTALFELDGLVSAWKNHFVT